MQNIERQDAYRRITAQITHEGVVDGGACRTERTRLQSVRLF
jgi:hypothetical protein